MCLVFPFERSFAEMSIYMFVTFPLDSKGICFTTHRGTSTPGAQAEPEASNIR